MSQESILSYEDFLFETWDYVSEHVISDADWQEETNHNIIREITYDYYQVYRKTAYREGSFWVTPFTTRAAATLLESTFSKVIKEGIIKVIEKNKVY